MFGLDGRNTATIKKKKPSKQKKYSDLHLMMVHITKYLEEQMDRQFCCTDSAASAA